jgi:D-alanyl-D-alanine carboxypeptidase/D-alanyl-D-alanine-endopeptidase (penicillin-binding protein 4)
VGIGLTGQQTRQWLGADVRGACSAVRRWVLAGGLVVASAAHAGPDEAQAWEDLLGPVMEAHALSRAEVGVQVVRVSDGEEVFARGADRAMLPASTMKVVTAAAALRALGPSYTFRTDVLTVGEVRGGVLQGDLVLVGRGDPTMVHERLWKLLRDIRQDGIDRVDGDLIVDDSFFDGDPMIPGWDSRHDLETGPSYFPSIGAVALDFGGLTLVVRPGTEVGKAAVVELSTPQRGYVKLDNGVATGRAGSRARVEITRKVLPGELVLEVRGTVPLDGSTRRYRRSVPEPTPYFLAVLREVLSEAGLVVEGEVRVGVVPPGAEVLRSLNSPPLTSVLMDTNKYSSNFMAETVLRALGAEARGEGSNEAGLQEVVAYLKRAGVPEHDFRLVNGSGLSRDIRLSPSALTAVLIDMARDRVVGPEFVASLSIAGQDGTLGDRMRSSGGLIRGKTGTLGGVHTVVGYVVAGDGELYACAFLANEIRGSLEPVKDVQDELLMQVVGWQGLVRTP